MNDHQLSQDQREAVDLVRGWFAAAGPGEAGQRFSLAGYAGTGKTTLTATIVGGFVADGVRILVGAPTGKAALRLRQKGLHAETIHRLAYRFAGHDEDGDPEFTWTGMGSADQKMLVVVDEASMVNEAIYRDLLAGGYRFLFVGDHGQLPPVGGDPGIMRSPDYALSVIHRQDDEGLLDFAHGLREGAHLPPARGAVEVVRSRPGRGTPREVAEADVVICWRNRTRHWLNHALMVARGILPRSLEFDADDAVGALRALGDRWVRVVCLRNDYRVGVFNGELLELLVEHVGRSSVIGRVRRDGDDGDGFETVADLAGFRADRPGQPAQGTLLLDFGYALTCHKAQGSEWDHVAVYDETHDRMEDRARWCYTAATRAKKRLSWVRG